MQEGKRCYANKPALAAKKCSIQNDVFNCNCCDCATINLIVMDENGYDTTTFDISNI